MATGPNLFNYTVLRPCFPVLLQLLHSQQSPVDQAAGMLLWDMSDADKEYVAAQLSSNPAHLSLLAEALRSRVGWLAEAAAAVLCNISRTQSGCSAILSAQLVVPQLFGLLSNKQLTEHKSRRQAGNCILNLLRVEPAVARRALEAVPGCRSSLEVCSRSGPVVQQCRDILSVITSGVLVCGGSD